MLFTTLELEEEDELEIGDEIDEELEDEVDKLLLKTLDDTEEILELLLEELPEPRHADRMHVAPITVRDRAIRYSAEALKVSLNMI